jgi:RNA polymerase-interacting CarD/CdnL/TRCF family regulator
MWKFRKLTEGELERHPHEAEFFNVGDIDKAASLVREVIQNSLDAKLPAQDNIRVRFTFGKHDKKDNDYHYSNLIPHVESCGLLPQYYASPEPIQFLTVEDFGTTGLDGPVSREEFKNGEGGNYYNFWWCEGKSQKAGHSAGRWGLGKISFHVASELRSFWGLTIRQDDNRELLLGKSLLITHHLDGAIFDYYGHFAGEGYNPIEDKNMTQQFRNTFAITRADQPGLSIVIPMPSPEINSSTIIRSVIIHYFFPIIKGMLIVEVNDGSSTITLDSSSLRDIAQQQDWTNSAWADRPVDSLMEFLGDAVTLPKEEINTLQTSAGSLKIREETFGGHLNELRNRFTENKLVCVKLPVKILHKDKPASCSYFEVYLKRDEALSRPDEFYVRGGITISEIKKLGNRKVRALLSAQDEAVCAFLGDCESPAHTDWKERTEKFQEKYHAATGTLRFIKSSMADIVRILDQPPPGIERDLLRDVFFIPEDVEEEIDVPKPPKKIEGKKIQKFEAVQIPGGFRIALSVKGTILPIQALVRVAYDIRGGNPFSNYHPMDFQLTDKNISIVINGGNIDQVTQNQIIANVTQDDFELRVTGFDERRDLIADVREV